MSIAQRIASLPPSENPFVELLTDPVGNQTTKEASSKKSAAPLQGMQIAVKDVIAVAGASMRAGTTFLKERSENDAAIVAMLRASGASIVGTTRTHELALGPTGLSSNETNNALINPRDPARIVGGSSSGSAVSVARQLTPLALGTDTGGSVRIPAAFCNVVGFKPTLGLIPMNGVLRVSTTLDHVGLLGQSVAHIARAARELLPSHPANRGMPPDAQPARRLAILESDVLGLSPSVQDLLEDTLDTLQSRGMRIASARIADHRALMEASSTILFYEASREFSHVLSEHSGSLSPLVRERLEFGGRISSNEYADALLERVGLMSELRQVFGDFDFLLGPTVPIPAPLRQEASNADIISAIVRNTRLGNLAGLPSISVPIGAIDSTVGLQIAGPPGSDLRVLELAQMIDVSLRTEPGGGIGANLDGSTAGR